MLISAITADPSIQPRETLNQEKLLEYSRVLLSGIDLEPVSVVFDGSTYWLADGFHRLETYRQGGKTEIPAIVSEGTRRDAILYGIERNVKHGLGLTLKEKKNAACRLLLDPEWAEWSNRKIGRICGLEHHTIKKLKAKLLSNNPSGEITQMENFTKTPVSRKNSVPSLLQSVSGEVTQIHSATNSYELNEAESSSITNQTIQDSDICKIKVFRNGKTYWMKWRDTSRLETAIDITSTTQVINEILPPSLNKPSSEFRVHLVSYDPPLFADNGIEISLKAMHTGPAYALPMIFDQFMFHPLFAASVFEQAQQLAKKSGENFNY